MHPKNLILALSVFIVILLSGCIKKEEYPDIPHIEFDSFAKIENSLGYDDKGILTLTFTDGNGDIGLGQEDVQAPFDTSSIYYYNFFITYFEKQEGVFVEVDLPFTINSRIPILNSSGRDKPMKGKIDIELYINNYFSPFDTIRFETFIVDRALNHSNTITTPEIIINK